MAINHTIIQYAPDEIAEAVCRKIDKESGRRNYNEVTLPNEKRETIISTINKHFGFAINENFVFCPYSKKYLVTDKGYLFSITHYTRGYLNEEKIRISNAWKEYERHQPWLFNLDNLNDDDPLSAGIKQRITSALANYKSVRKEVENARRITKLHLFSDKTTVEFSIDGRLLSEEERSKGVREAYTPHNAPFFQSLGYEVKQQEELGRSKNTYDPVKGKITEISTPYISYFVLINKNALITSTLQGKLAKKGYTWKDGKEVAIRQGRKPVPYTIFDDKGEIHNCISQSDLAKKLNVSTRALRDALSKRNGKELTIKGRSYTLRLG